MDEINQLKSENEALTKSVVEIAGELFRFRRVFNKAISKLEPDDQSKYMSQFAWFSKRVDKATETAGLRVLDIQGQLFDPGLAVTALNIEDFDADDELYVEQMMEPIIMRGDSIQKTGTVILGRVEK